LARTPSQVWFLGTLLHVVEKIEGPRAAVDYFLERREAFEALPEVPTLTAYVWSNVAWSALGAGAASQLAIADECSERAMRIDPSLPTVRAARGAVLLTKGERDSGLPLLTIALREIEEPEAKAEVCQFMAADADRRGDGVLSAEYLALANHLQKAA
jgi:predicted Zn-dependent protease